MPSPSVTYSFTNGTATDASQVNTNFTDLINSMSDGTKDFSINALTCAGTATLNGNVNIGNSSADDLSVTASLASDIPVKTTGTYNFGSSTKGMLSMYFGNASNSNTVRILGGVTTSSYTMTLPVNVGLTYDVPYSSDGSGTLAFRQATSSLDIENLTLTATVATNALTVAVKTKAGSDASSTTPIVVGFRNSTATTGTYLTRSITGALSVVVSSGSTLGHISAFQEYVYVYLIDNAGTLELAVSGCADFDDGSLVTTTAEGGAGAADTRTTLYSTTARSNVPCRLIGRLSSTQATAGTWATAIAEISLAPFNKPAAYSEVVVHTGNGWGSTNTKIRRFSTTKTNIGTDITYAESANNGASFTINKKGLYTINYEDRHSVAAERFGFSLNGTALTTNIGSINESERLAMVWNLAGQLGQVNWIGRLNATDVIRPHGEGISNDNTVGQVRFQIKRIGD